MQQATFIHNVDPGKFTVATETLAQKYAFDKKMQLWESRQDFKHNLHLYLSYYATYYDILVYDVLRGAARFGNAPESIISEIKRLHETGTRGNNLVDLIFERYGKECSKGKVQELRQQFDQLKRNDSMTLHEALHAYEDLITKMEQFDCVPTHDDCGRKLATFVRPDELHLLSQALTIDKINRTKTAADNDSLSVSASTISPAAPGLALWYACVLLCIHT